MTTYNGVAAIYISGLSHFFYSPWLERFEAVFAAHLFDCHLAGIVRTIAGVHLREQAEGAAAAMTEADHDRPGSDAKLSDR
ncbi:MAG: hypothetical protein AAGA73_12525 [Pseudomonadota bacterium]